MKRNDYTKHQNAHYEARAESRPRQVWKKAKKDGSASTRYAAAKDEIGAIPVHVGFKLI